MYDNRTHTVTGLTVIFKSIFIPNSKKGKFQYILRLSHPPEMFTCTYVTSFACVSEKKVKLKTLHRLSNKEKLGPTKSFEQNLKRKCATYVFWENVV